MKAQKKTNHLASETSPYLLQHAHNPVDWYPWGDEALAKARAKNLPILLSVGYSACHWCHVMERECFENPDIAALMNVHFVSIKVDREERPDLDQIYQNVAQLMTRSGGWPLTVFLTPELKPFYGGTYFPPADHYGRPGFPRVLQALAQAYQSGSADIAENARRLTAAIENLGSVAANGNRRPDSTLLTKTALELLELVDWESGGFGGAPKFPNTMGVTFLWRMGNSADNARAREAVALTLRKMAEGGIYDQLGGGFHRYSVDATWSVPHFEKMLYDNALLLKLYAEVLLTDRFTSLGSDTRRLFTEIIRDTVEYLLREMLSPEGAFYSTQDADSEGEEGKFFVWDAASLRTVLSEEEARAFALRYGVTEEGGVENGKTVLFVARPIEEIANTLKIEGEEVLKHIQSARRKCFFARLTRACPARDEKVLASWNGLMISGLCWAAQALVSAGDKETSRRALDAAAGAFEFVRARMAREKSPNENRLMSVYKDGRARFNAYLDDYAFMAMAALDLARFTSGEKKAADYTAAARAWIDVCRTHFDDKKAGGFFFTSDDHEKLISRPKTVYDQAIPSGTSIAMQCLAALAEIQGVEDYAREADEHLHRLTPLLDRGAFGMAELACAALTWVQGAITLQGVADAALFFHPHVFRKPAQASVSELLLCHAQTCLPMKNTAQARAEILGRSGGLLNAD